MSKAALLVVGASSDLGRELIARVCSKPDPPAILAHYHEGEAAVRALQSSFGTAEIIPVKADLRDPAAVAEMAAMILASYGAPRQIVHLPAASMKYERFAKLDWKRLEADLAIQLHSIVSLLQTFLPHLRQRSAERVPPAGSNAKVVFVLSSVTLGLPPKYLTAYTVVKCALLGLMRSLAAEYGADGITFNAVSPAMMETQFLKDIPEMAVQLAAQNHPLGRNAGTGDVAPTIEFLLSPGSDYMNGVNIPVTGGLLI